MTHRLPSCIRRRESRPEKNGGACFSSSLSRFWIGEGARTMPSSGSNGGPASSSLLSAATLLLSKNDNPISSLLRLYSPSGSSLVISSASLFASALPVNVAASETLNEERHPHRPRLLPDDIGHSIPIPERSCVARG